MLLAKPTAAAAAAGKQWAAVALPANGKSLAVLDPATGGLSELSLDPSLAAAAAISPLADGALLHVSSSSSSSGSSSDSAVVALAHSSGSSLELSTVVKCGGGSSDCAVGGGFAIVEDSTTASGASSNSRVYAVRAARDATGSSTVAVALHEVVAGKSSGATTELQYELPVEERGAIKAVFPEVSCATYIYMYV